MTAIDRRVGFLFLGFMLLLGVALMRATYLGAFKADSLQHAASSQQIVQTQIPATRGAITDRTGVQLAISQSAADVVADPAGAPFQARRLAGLLTVTMQAALLVRHAPAAVSDAFCATRLAGQGGLGGPAVSFGTLPGGLDHAALLDRTRPVLTR